MRAITLQGAGLAPAPFLSRLLSMGHLPEITGRDATRTQHKILTLLKVACDAPVHTRT
jgi:hypothetical protein